MPDHGYGRVMHELGTLGIGWEESHTLLSAAMNDASKVHSMGARGLALIPGTEKAVVYDSGTDGLDYAYRVEDAPEPDVHVDWHMTPAEWEELRSILTGQVAQRGNTAPYLYRLYQEGKLGAVSPAVKARVAVLEGLFAKTHEVSKMPGLSAEYKCSCGHQFISLHGSHGRVQCPLSPGYEPCR